MEIKGKALKIKTIKTALKNSYGNNKKRKDLMDMNLWMV